KLKRTSVLRSRMGKSQFRNGVTGRKKITSGSNGLKRSAARTNTIPLIASGSANGLTRALAVRARAAPIMINSTHQLGGWRSNARDVAGLFISIAAYLSCFQ